MTVYQLSRLGGKLIWTGTTEMTQEQFAKHAKTSEYIYTTEKPEHIRSSRRVGQMKIQKEICNECGKSVAFGTGLFVNRIGDFNDYNTRLSMNKPFPEGAFICAECDDLLTKRRFKL